MKKHFVVVGLLTLALAGCGHRPVYTQAYYAKHPKAEEKALAYCQDHKKVSHAREQDCQAAANAELIYGTSGKPNKPVTYGKPNFGWLN
ncbi:EexN family lipoprotein [Acidithiobacillus sp. VAN18-1]|uniref:EexN family lipoprotein n=1 Tax=Igneacidithiobacillus copahuensis TaxID=2724909 RepID=A0AAE2YQ16_9PROT|nr:EexN family lipoprotein [Igneacidithiobacillus copahuensis]MBU2788237.1 EexN family lipoprotein [Igneacidithiobacillus copahuensis]MBU2797113.1 EexN family lipoprotein [Acidithiobacillus sp. VAN18-2]